MLQSETWLSDWTTTITTTTTLYPKELEKEGQPKPE